jgi:Calcium binding
MAKARKKPTGKPKRDEAREHRITMEIVVDYSGEGEQVMGWYYYLEDKLHVPSLTRCVQERAISPLRIGDEVEVVGMAPEDECGREMFVEMPWEHKRTLAVPLSQLEVIDADEGTRQAVEDWHYWVEMGYGF